MSVSGTPQIFDTVSTVDGLGLFSRGKVDYGAVAGLLELDKNALSKVGGISKKSVRLDDRIPKELASRLEEIANICNLVAEYFDGNVTRTALWFKIPNPMLGNISPRDMIRYGRYRRLRKFVVDSLPTSRESNKQPSLHAEVEITG